MECTYCEGEFTVNSRGSGGTNRAFCFECFPEGLNKKERTARRTELLTDKSRKEKLAIGCSICGYIRNASALEWHHPLDDKLGHPSNAIKRSWKAYKEEVSRCVLLCANCHRETHYN